MPLITLHTNIKSTPKIVFDLSRSIDLHKISTAKTNEDAVAGVTSGLIGLGEWVTWRAKHLGVYQQLTSKITEYSRPDYFVDEMQKGIFKRFKHQHLFKDLGDSTLMTDIFDYDSPLGVLGKIADIVFLKKYMTRLLLHRNQIIKNYAESGQWKNILPADDS